MCASAMSFRGHLQNSAAALGLLGLIAACDARPPFEPLSLDALAASLHGELPPGRGLQGIRLDLVDGMPIRFDLPGLRAFQCEVSASTPLALIEGCWNGDGSIDFGSPVRRVRVTAEPTSVCFDLGPFASYCPTSRLALMARGSGTLALSAPRVARAPTDPVAFRRAADRATFWSSESPCHTTVNFLTPPWMDAARTRFLPDLLAASAASGGLLLWLGARRCRRRIGSGAVLAAAVLAAFVAYDAYFLVRTLPALTLVPETDPEARLRDHCGVAPGIGDLLALARATLPLDARVGVVAAPDDWFGREMLCYHLAPRRCVVFEPGVEELHGLFGVGHLAPSELDALVVVESDARLPPGFTVVARTNPHSYVARKP